MGIDHGRRRIGIALSDPTWTLASPLTTLTRRRGKRPPVGRLAELAAENDVCRFVVGLPREEDGADPSWIEEIRQFAAKLHSRTGLPVHLRDEGYSTIEAESRLQEGARRRKRDKKHTDAAAAAVILQDWLDEGQPDG